MSGSKYSRYISDMSLREKAAYVLCPGIRPGAQAKAEDRELFDDVFKDRSIKTGSIFVFGGTPEEIRETILKANEGQSTPVLVAADTEVGAGKINHAANKFTTAMGLAAANNLEYIYKTGTATALEALPAGINWSFGPNIDLNLNPLNPITNTRSFGDDACLVAKRVANMIRGIQDNKTAATPKHFPGDGVDNRDQHICTSVNSLSREEWMDTYGKVWKAAINAGAKAVMTGHIALPAFEDNHEIIPATLSYNLTTKLLRETLRFDGVVVTDALNMGGIISHQPIDDLIINTILAGSDVLLFVNFLTTLEHAVDVIENALKNGRLPEEKLNISIERILKLKDELGLLDENYSPFVPLSKEKHEEFYILAAEINQKSITLYKNDKHHIPIDIYSLKRVMSIDVTNNQSLLKPDFDNLLRDNGIEVVKYDEFGHSGLPRADTLAGYDAVFVNFYFSPIWASNHIRVGSRILQRLYEYFYRLSIPVIAVAYGSPYIVREFPKAPTVILAYTDNSSIMHCVFDVVFGNKKATGVCPVNLEK